eukprot:4548495-Pyramimonas_sp.AAC.1
MLRFKPRAVSVASMKLAPIRASCHVANRKRKSSIYGRQRTFPGSSTCAPLHGTRGSRLIASDGRPTPLWERKF